MMHGMNGDALDAAFAADLTHVEAEGLVHFWRRINSGELRRLRGALVATASDGVRFIGASRGTLSRGVRRPGEALDDAWLRAVAECDALRLRAAAHVADLEAALAVAPEGYDRQLAALRLDLAKMRLADARRGAEHYGVWP